MAQEILGVLVLVAKHVCSLDACVYVYVVWALVGSGLWAVLCVCMCVCACVCAHVCVRMCVRGGCVFV